MKTLPCTVCGQESYERLEGSKTVLLCPLGHQKADTVQEWNDAYANKMIRELVEKVDKLEEELDAASTALETHLRCKRERDEARLLVRRLLDPQWKAAGIEKTAFNTMRDWGLGVIQ